MTGFASAPFFTSPEKEISVAGDHSSKTIPIGESITLDGIQWPDRGSLEFLLRLEGMESSRQLGLKSGETVGVRFLRTPAFDLQLFFGNRGTGGFGLIFHTEDGNEHRFNAPFIHLRGDQTYHIIINWDLEKELAEVFYNGISQGDIMHGRAISSPLVLRAERQTMVSGQFGGGAQISLELGAFTLSNEFVSPEQAAANFAQFDIPPLVDEGRVTYDHPMDLSGYKLTEIFSADFSQPISVIRELDLFDDGQRVRKPSTSHEWVLEGPEGMILETRENGLFMETPLPEDNTDGHWVLWANKVFPDNILIEYDFTPRDDRQGLNILFFSAHYPEGETIFDLDLPYRGGNFRPYIVGEINSYHISPWATDGQNLRATSNMRKNSGFILVARGNDVIGGGGPGPHTVRILKAGDKIRMESNGLLCLAFDDDGRSYGPVHQDGFIGVRFMAHTGHATLHNLRVYSVEKMGTEE